MHQPDNARLLAQSAALNTLFDEKSFSWTLTMEDLETTLPGGVQVSTSSRSSTKPATSPCICAFSGARDKAIDFVRNLEHARRFPNPASSAKPRKAPPLLAR